jgi:hypothetical protein
LEFSRTIEKSSDTGNPRNVLLMLVGATLVIMGGALLLSAGLIAIDILDNPSDVKIVALILQEMAAEGPALHGDLDGMRFAIGIGEPLRTLLFLVVVVWLLGVLVSILKTLVLTGKDLLSTSSNQDAD